MGDRCMPTRIVYDPDDFDNLFESDRTTTLNLDSATWDNTLVRNCRIHDTSGEGIFIKDCSNIVIQNCEIDNVTFGVKTSSSGGSTGVIIDDCFIHDCSEDGVKGSQVGSTGVDSPGMIVRNCSITVIGVGQSGAARHPMYLQNSDVLVENNRIYGARHGNGISIRSSGVIRCNNISGTSETSRPGIRYHSDNVKGASNLLLIERNSVTDAVAGIDLNGLVDEKFLWDFWNPAGAELPLPSHVCENFIIRDNTVRAPAGSEITVDADYSVANGFSVDA